MYNKWGVKGVKEVKGVKVVKEVKGVKVVKEVKGVKGVKDECLSREKSLKEAKRLLS